MLHPPSPAASYHGFRATPEQEASLIEGMSKTGLIRSTEGGAVVTVLSHAADAFGYLAISYEEPPVKSRGIGRPPAGSHWAA